MAKRKDEGAPKESHTIGNSPFFPVFGMLPTVNEAGKSKVYRKEEGQPISPKAWRDATGITNLKIATI